MPSPAVRAARFALLLSAIVLLPLTASAGTKVFEDGDTYIEAGARIQIQYNRAESGGEATDEIMFRRIRPYLAGSLTRNWYGKVEFDFGKASDADEVALKDAYFAYTGFNREGYARTIGNAKAPFGREFLTSSKKLQRAEIALVGDHNYGTLDRVLGLHLAGSESEGRFGWGISAGSESHDPSSDRMDFDTPVNGQSDWNEGWAASARVEVFPMGPMKYDQGDLKHSDPKVSLALAGYIWANDDDRNTYTDSDGESENATKADLDQATGLEASAGFRGKGLSADAELHRVHGETVVQDFTGGLYQNGETNLTLFSGSAGYMLVQKRLEAVVGYDILDASNYASTWTTLYVGANVFLDGHNLKFQGGYSLGRNANGVTDQDLNQVTLLAAYVF